MMETPRLLNLLLLLLCFFAVSESSASRVAFLRRPGFVFTRTRGRCTPQFLVPETSTVRKVFGSRAYERYRSDMTLMEATADAGEEAFGWLLKEATAALINSYARREFPYAAWEVKTLFIQALVSSEAAAAQSLRFSVANESCY